MMFLYQQPPTDYLTIMFLIYIKTSSTAFIYLDALGIIILSNKIPTYVHKFWSFNLICIQNKKLQFYKKWNMQSLSVSLIDMILKVKIIYELASSFN